MISFAFTCAVPYAILIMLGIKRVENRADRPVQGKGRCAVSCSKSFCKEEYGEFVRWASRALSAEEFATIPSWDDVKEWPGKIVGCCDYSVRGRNDLVLTSNETVPQWDEGYDFFWDLTEIVCLDQQIPCRGNQGMWTLPLGLAAQINVADRLSACVGEKVSTVEEAKWLFYDAVPIAGPREGFFVLPLDQNRRVLSAPILVSLGTDSGTTVVQPSEVFSAALKLEAKAVIVAHNHPSGDITPSAQDYELTDQLKWLGTKIGVEVLDHLIVLGEQWCVVERN